MYTKYMRIYKIRLEGYWKKQWHSNWRLISVHAESFDESINKVELEKNERIEEVELVAESDY